jgi:hypothetical protein
MKPLPHGSISKVAFVSDYLILRIVYVIGSPRFFPKGGSQSILLRTYVSDVEVKF